MLAKEKGLLRAPLQELAGSKRNNEQLRLA